MNYKVLWIDDDYQKQTDVISHAEQDGIEIEAYESHEEGMTALQADLKTFHAVILDAKVKKGKNDTVPSLSGLSASRDMLIEINKDIFLPYFIFTGQPDYTTDEIFHQSYGDFFIKGLDDQKLFDAIKESVDGKEEYIIQKKYKKVFDVCNGNDLEQGCKKHLFDILKSIEFHSVEFDDEKYFNGLRKILEHIFRAANKLSLLHDKCIPNSNVNLTWSSMYMAGNEVEIKDQGIKIKSLKIHFPVILANTVYSILNITSAASHTDSEKANIGKTNFAEYKIGIKSNYLLYSLAFQIMDLILWFKVYSDQNSNKLQNKSYWSEKPIIMTQEEWIKGTVIKISSNGYGDFLSESGKKITLIPEKINNNNLKEGDNIEVVIKALIDKIRK